MDYNICEELLLLDKKSNIEEDQYFVIGTKHLFGKEEIAKLLNESGISICAAGIISCITGYLGPRLTAHLLSGRKDEYYDKVKSALSIALLQVPEYKNGLIYRHESYGCEKVFDWFKNHIGRKVQFPFFQSCSKDKWEDWSLYYRIITANDNTKAKDVTVVQNILNEERAKYEREVLIDLRAIFLIEGVIDNEVLLRETYLEKEEQAIMLKYNFWK